MVYSTGIQLKVTEVQLLKFPSSKYNIEALFGLTVVMIIVTCGQSLSYLWSQCYSNSSNVTRSRRNT